MYNNSLYVIDNVDSKIILKIYNEVFLKRNEHCLDVFLCGKARTSGKNLPLRDVLRIELEKDTQIRILYPEDLFIDFFNANRQYDMLEMESFLAENSDIICIVCEDSPGALVELGAFTNNNKTYKKVIALIDNKYKKDKSFIMLGPIKYIQKINKENVLFYTDDNTDIARNLLKVFNNKLRKMEHKVKNIDTLIGLHDFIISYLYYIKKTTAQSLNEIIKFIAINESIKIKDQQLLYNSTIKLLFKEKLIEKTSEDTLSEYMLTEKGINEFNYIFSNLREKRKTKSSDLIRLSIIKRTHY